MIFVDFPCPDPEAMSNFYADLFGWTFNRRPAGEFHEILPGREAEPRDPPQRPGDERPGATDLRDGRRTAGVPRHRRWRWAPPCCGRRRSGRSSAPVTPRSSDPWGAEVCLWRDKGTYKPGSAVLTRSLRPERSAIADEAVRETADGAGDAGAGQLVRVRRDGRFVDVDAEAGPVRHGERAVDDRLRSSRARCRTSTSNPPGSAGTRQADRRHRGREVEVGGERRRVRRTCAARRGRRTRTAAAAIRRASTGRRTWTRPAAARAAVRGRIASIASSAPKRCSPYAIGTGSGEPAPRCPRGHPAASAPRTTGPRARADASRNVRAPSATVKISLPSTISCTRRSSSARSSASMARSASQSGPTRTFTFVTPRSSSGASSSA